MGAIVDNGCLQAHLSDSCDLQCRSGGLLDVILINLLALKFNLYPALAGIYLRQAADPDRPLAPDEWGVLEDVKPPRDPQNDDQVAELAREKVHAMFGGAGSTSTAGGEEVASVEALAWSGLDDPSPLIVQQTPWSESEGGGRHRVMHWVGTGEPPDDEEDLDDLFDDYGNPNPTPPIHNGRGEPLKKRSQKKDTDVGDENVSGADGGGNAPNPSTQKIWTRTPKGVTGECDTDVTGRDALTTQLDGTVSETESRAGRPELTSEGTHKAEAGYDDTTSRRLRRAKSSPSPSSLPPMATVSKATLPSRREVEIAVKAESGHEKPKATNRKVTGSKTNGPDIDDAREDAWVEAEAAVTPAPVKRGRGRPRQDKTRKAAVAEREDADDN